MLLKLFFMSKTATVLLLKVNTLIAETPKKKKKIQKPSSLIVNQRRFRYRTFNRYTFPPRSGNEPLNYIKSVTSHKCTEEVCYDIVNIIHLYSNHSKLR